MLGFRNYIKTTLLLEEKLDDFVQFACDHLKLQEKPQISLVQVRDDNMTTANYCPNSQKIKVYAKNRALFDVARSVAHELVHHKQNVNGEELNGDTGSACENEANSVAGQIIRLYGEKNPDFYE
jgi:hypothetical protein